MFIAGTPGDAAELKAMGADIINLGSDHEFLQTGAQRFIQAVHGNKI
ncbi:MAG: hypothetical protein IJW67_08905 [Blautia sp.]|nr:hypothetical protein [Blautia sp.]